MAIDVEHRHEDQHQLVEGTLGRFSIQHLAQGQEAGILAIDLAGMNTTLDEDDRQLLCLCTAHGTAGRNNQGLHRTPFRGTTEFDAAHRIRIAFGKRVAQPDHFFVAAGTREAGLFGDGLQRIGACHCKGRGKQGKQAEQVQADRGHGRATGEGESAS